MDFTTGNPPGSKSVDTLNVAKFGSFDIFLMQQLAVLVCFLLLKRIIANVCMCLKQAEVCNYIFLK